VLGSSSNAAVRPAKCTSPANVSTTSCGGAVVAVVAVVCGVADWNGGAAGVGVGPGPQPAVSSSTSATTRHRRNTRAAYGLPHGAPAGDAAAVTADRDADVIVVGAGPGGSATAYHLARHGFNVLLLERATLPREKVCGDGLTPRAVVQLEAMGIDTSDTADAGWTRNRGVRFVIGRTRVELDWPELSDLPAYGLTRTRNDLDALLAGQAVQAGAELHTGTAVTGTLLDGDGRVVGVRATGPDGELRTLRSSLVVDAGGVSARLALALGMTRRTDRPMGVAVRQYYRSPARQADPYLEADLGIPVPGRGPLAGYGWVFGLGDGRVNVGVGLHDSAGRFRHMNLRPLLAHWLRTRPELGEDATADGPVRGAGLPMGFSRVPHYRDGLLLVGDSGGMVNPFNGEGIAYALESGALAASIAVDALSTGEPARRERTLAQYPAVLRRRHGSYYRLGRGFVKMIDNERLTRFGIAHVLPRPAVARFMFLLASNLTEPRGGDPTDRVVAIARRLTPA
jgi:menaquinone-9 beta-reductase